jgi:hypothetical protein
MAVSAPALWPEETALFRINRLSPKVLILTEISPMENMIVALASRPNNTNAKEALKRLQEQKAKKEK